MKLHPPFDGHFRITSNFAAHQARKPPSNAPGIDYALPKRTPVLAAADGALWRARYSATGGRHIMILSEDDTVTLYSHLSCICALPGEQVKAGQLIGYSGNTGRTTGPHLHFAVRKAGRWIDPAPLLRQP